MEETKYTVESAGPSIEEFLDMVLDHLDFDVEYEILEGQHLHPDLEDPDLLVKFTGPEVDLLLANKAELMLAVEFLTMEMLRMPPEHHSRLCFDANDYRMLRIEELRLSAQTAAEKVKQTRRPFHFQSDEQPRAPHHPLEPSQRNRHPQREHRNRPVPPGRCPTDRYAASRADPPAASHAATPRWPAQTAGGPDGGPLPTW